MLANIVLAIRSISNMRHRSNLGMNFRRLQYLLPQLWRMQGVHSQIEEINTGKWCKEQQSYNFLLGPDLQNKAFSRYKSKWDFSGSISWVTFCTSAALLIFQQLEGFYFLCPFSMY